MEDVLKMRNLSDDNEIFRGFTMMELYNAFKYITTLFFIQKILRFHLGVAFLKSVSIYNTDIFISPLPITFNQYFIN